MNERLKKLSTFNGRPGPVVLCIMDGIGVGPADEGNAVSRAYTPHLDWLRDHCPWRLLQAHGTAVGLPSDADMGNSEVGHNAIGCGRVFAQGAKLVNLAIEQRTLFEGKIWQEQIENV
ncbi:MAG: 2,3-bisphosphoglycerate-independent phosphoglycerate mutase, partial [Lentisphaerae bacterium]